MESHDNDTAQDGISLDIDTIFTYAGAFEEFIDRYITHDLLPAVAGHANGIAHPAPLI